MAERRSGASTRKSHAHAMAAGAEMARQAIAGRRSARRTRAKALATVKIPRSTGKKAKPSSASAKTAVAKTLSAGTLIAEGDSWFDYPFCDVLKALEDEHGFDVESVAHKGDMWNDLHVAGSNGFGRVEQPPYSIMNLRIGLNPEGGHWLAELYVRNLTDKNAIIYSNTGNFDLRETTNEPRVIGTIFTMKQGQLSKPIRGETGVFVVAVVSFTEPAPAKENSVKNNSEQNDVVFKVQVMSSDKKIPLNSAQFKGLAQVSEYRENNLFKYTTGVFDTVNDATQFQRKVREQGFKEAFVVAFFKGNRIAMKDVLQMKK